MVLVHGYIRRISERAILLFHEETDQDIWVPKSIIVDYDKDDFAPETCVDFYVPDWFARKEYLD